jgi:hypothetical protein
VKKPFAAIFTITCALASPAAHAVDGCKVLLCLAGNWSNISQCRPEVEQAMWDASHGRGWPTCGMSGAGNTANFGWLSEANCPEFYRDYGTSGGDSGYTVYTGCRGYGALISVHVNNAPWIDLFWSFSGAPSSTRYYSPARAALVGNIDPKYDTDAAAYMPPAPPSPCIGGDSC